MTKINATKVLSLLDKAVAERGVDFVYQEYFESEDCMYFVEDEPGCIAGYVLHELGISPTEARVVEGWPVRDTVEAIASNPDPNAIRANEFFEERFTKNGIAVLRAAQSVQDLRNTWGAAVREAHATAARLSETFGAIS